tara:strand:+ start:614 stop:949 length:336 start_codon:yes stop_codon:yes gene_type:complete
MKEYNQYGKNEKKIMFADTDKRHADLRAKLKRDGLSQVKFFQSMVTGYIDNDENIAAYIALVKTESTSMGKKRIKKCYEEILEGQSLLADYGLSEKEREFVFDSIEKLEEE